MLEIEENADFYWKRGHCYREIELFIDATDDLQKACDIRPYPQASISNRTFFNKMQFYF